MPKLSVVIPTYNRAHFLVDTLDSVLGQTFRDLEVLVVDNASTDDTPQLMDGYMARDSRVRYLRKPVNLGLIHSYNMGWQNATGDYLAFFDSDDLMERTRLAKQVRILDEQPDVDLVFTRFVYIDTNGRKLRKTPFLPESDHLKHLVQSCFIMQNSTLARRSAWEKGGGEFDPKLNQTQDWLMLLNMLLSGCKFACIQEPLYLCRIHANNNTRNVRPEEEDINEILHRAYSDPRLPQALRALEPSARAQNCLWSAYGYYNNGYFDDGKRKLSEAFVHAPEWRTNRAQLVAYWRDIALTPWVFQPVEFMRNVLDHLPDDAVWLNDYRAELMAAMHIGVAFRHINQNEVEPFQQHMQAAVVAQPSLLTDPKPLLDRLYSDAQASPMESPSAFVDAVMANLPPSLSALREHRQRAMTSVEIESAFADYMHGNKARVPAHVLQAARLQPASLANRGLMSILVRSLPATLFGA